MPDITIRVDEFDNGYRPTASGLIDGVALIFLMDGSGRWLFGVGTTEASAQGEISWMCGEEDFAFITEGTGVPTYHTESLPFFLDGLGQYLGSLRLEAGEIEQITQSATEQALALFATG